MLSQPALAEVLSRPPTTYEQREGKVQNNICRYPRRKCQSNGTTPLRIRIRASGDSNKSSNSSNERLLSPQTAMLHTTTPLDSSLRMIYLCTLLVFGMVLAFGAGVLNSPTLTFQPMITSTITFPCLEVPHLSTSERVGYPAILYVEVGKIKQVYINVGIERSLIVTFSLRFPTTR